MNIKKHLHSVCKRLFKALLLSGGVGWGLLFVACYSNNCPMENTVLCNFGFYDAEGTAISYGDELTVTTLMPGEKTMYIYKKLGNKTVERDYIDSMLIDDGYTVTETVQRNDTVLMNKLSRASRMSLPMSYFNTADTLVIAYASIVQKDTIVIQKDSYAHVEQPECGTHRFHTLRGISSTSFAIDHVEIAQPKVNYDGVENIKIFFNGVASD